MTATIDPTALTAGTIAVAAHADGERHLVHIYKTHDTHLQIEACHPYTEYATSDDHIHWGACRYPVVVQHGLRGIIDHHQILAVVGHLAASTTNSTGPRLTGPFDARWAFKAAEGNRLRKLCREATLGRIGWAP